MAKQIAPLNNFSGGLNTSTNERDIQNHEYVIGDNIDSGITGRLRCIGKWDESFYTGDSTGAIDDDIVVAGYGIFPFNVDKNTLGADVEGKYIAIYKPHASTAEVIIKVSPQVSGEDFITGVIPLTAAQQEDTGGVGAGGVSSKLHYLYADGSLRISSRDHDFDPQKWYYQQPNVYYFTNGLDIANNGTAAEEVEYITGAGTDGAGRDKYKLAKQFVDAPHTGGGVTVSSDSTPEFGGTLTSPATNMNYTMKVGLLIHQYDQGGAYPTGWGKSSSTASGTYNFYASFVYDGNQESLATLIGTASGLGGNTAGNVDNDLSFTAVVRPRSANDGTIYWNDRITSVRIYYNKDEADPNIKYFIGDYPTSSFDSTEKLCVIDQSDGHAYLKGDGTGKGTGAFNGIGIYHESPPVIFTHAVKSGIRPETISTECKYATGAIVNRKLYVGNIEQKTVDSPSALKKYPDRLLKSIPNRFDVLPDTEFVDVAVQDGENIVRLIGLGNRLIQFKERTMYAIAVAGGEEYLEAKFPHMGILHPEAVVNFQQGLFWVNEFGAYIFDGQQAPMNAMLGKIDSVEWSNFITANSIVGYHPQENKLIVVGDCTKLYDDDDAYFDSNAEMYYFNLSSQSWNKQVNAIGEAGTLRAGISNIANYADTSGVSHTIFEVGFGESTQYTDIVEYKSVDSLSSYPTIPVTFKTRDLTADVPHQRKVIYGLYITYKGNMNTSGLPEITKIETNADSSGSLNSRYFIIYDADGKNVIQYDVGNQNPSAPSESQVETLVVELNSNDSANEVAAKTATALQDQTAILLDAYVDEGNELIITDRSNGVRTNASHPSSGETGFGISINQEGLASGGYTPPAVKLHLRGRDSNIEVITLEGKTQGKDFENATDWKIAHYVVKSVDKSKARNVYSVQIEVSHSAMDSSFQINDMSLLFKLKNVS